MLVHYIHVVSGAFCLLLTVKTIFCSAQNDASVYQQNAPANSKRSLNNYVAATSIPYIVDNKTVNSSDWQRNSYAKETLSIPNDSSYSLHAEVAECSAGKSECVRNLSSSSGEWSAEATFQPYSQDELNKILQKYEGQKEDDMRAQETNNAVVALYNDNNRNNIEAAGGSSNLPDHNDKSKSWNLINSQAMKNPYDDRMGWVTLEPIAWSSSQVQKWEPNQKPMWPSPSQVNNPQWNSEPQQQQLQPSYSWTTDRPWKRPTYQFQQKPWNGNQNYDKPQYGSNLNSDIITDGQPGYFPQERPSSGYKPWNDQNQGHGHVQGQGQGQSQGQNQGYENHNRPPTQIAYQGPVDRLPPTSSDGDGHWVLLSSTKGYSVPHRQKSSARSLDLAKSLDDKDEEPPPRPLPKRKSSQVSSKRTVRLTVLPPLPGTTKTVTSHGGMLEVESTKQTVDEAHREHVARMMRFQNDSSTNEIPKRTVGGGAAEFQIMPPTKTTDKVQSNRRSALLAAVSAGMIPATMAMLLPLLIGRRKRNVPEPATVAPQVVTLNFKKFDTPGIVTRYTRKENKESPKKKVFTKSYALYQ